jgi:hypothetical protein
MAEADIDDRAMTAPAPRHRLSALFESLRAS